MILGNKCDANDKRQVSREQGEKVSMELSCLSAWARQSINPTLVTLLLELGFFLGNVLFWPKATEPRQPGLPVLVSDVPQGEKALPRAAGVTRLTEPRQKENEKAKEQTEMCQGGPSTEPLRTGAGGSEVQFLFSANGSAQADPQVAVSARRVGPAQRVRCRAVPALPSSHETCFCPARRQFRN